MLSQRTTSSQFDADPGPGFVVFLPPGEAARERVRAELAAAGVDAQAVGPGVRVEVGEVDWRAMLGRVAAGLNEAERRDTRLAVVPRGADERGLRRALALAKSLETVLTQYADDWVHGLLAPGRLAVSFQPLVEYPPGAVHGYECLVRAPGPDGAEILPARLFEAAGRAGVRYLLDRQATATAMGAAAQTGYAALKFFVNVSAAGIERADVLARSSREAADAGGLSIGQVVFEIVDAEALCAGGLPGRRHLSAVTDTLRAAGFAVALDDVGPASPLLTLVEDLSPAYVKFEGEACRAAERDRAAAEVLRAACTVVARHGAIAVAKGLETEDQLRAAMDAGATITQGRIHAPPAPTPLEAHEEDLMLRQVRRTAILAID